MKHDKKQVLRKTEKEREEMKTLVKAIYKSILKTLKNKKDKEETDRIVEDILDPNYVAQVDPDGLPTKTDKVMWKKDSKSSKSQEKGVSKLKRMCKKKRVQKICKDEPIPGLDQN